MTPDPSLQTLRAEAEQLLDALSGPYPSMALAELRGEAPRIIRDLLAALDAPQGGQDEAIRGTLAALQRTVNLYAGDGIDADVAAQLRMDLEHLGALLAARSPLPEPPQ